MIPKDCKRLAEVDFPIAAVSKLSQIESSGRAAHPKRLHLWWARRPLAACRSVLLAMLLPDPCDQRCPAGFKSLARRLISSSGLKPGVGLGSEDRRSDEALRAAMLEMVAHAAGSEGPAATNAMRVGTELVRACYDGRAPIVLDSFAGGGSIPIEALRLGCDGIGTDWNPIACAILRASLELGPRSGHALAEGLAEAGERIWRKAQARLEVLFPEEAEAESTIAYFWMREARCEAPACGITFPLASSLWLSKRHGNKAALRLVPRDDGSPCDVEVFIPEKDSDVQRGTVGNGLGVCPRCGVVLTNNRLRAQLAACDGGIRQARLVATASQRAHGGARIYRTASASDREAAARAAALVVKMEQEELQSGLSLFPHEIIPRSELRRISAPLYGCRRWCDLFLPRQLVALAVLSDEIRSADLGGNGSQLMLLLALAFSKVLRHWNSNAKWHTKSETVAGAFGRQAIPMTYLFPEQTIWADGAGSWVDAIASVGSAVGSLSSLSVIGQAYRADACHLPFPSESVDVWFTDPPYYDAVAYAHLADFFYVWMRRLLPHDTLFQTVLIDKTEECVVDRPHSLSPTQKGASWFEQKMESAMGEARRLLADDGLGAVIFAHKSTAGWEALLSAMLRGGWVITASWPIATERVARLNARDNASLSTSVHLICRPRPDDAGVGDWADVLRELPTRVGDWMERLQGEGVRGADLVFACIGPALEIFSRYAKVETAEGREVALAEYLEKVWEVVGRSALAQVLGTSEAKARNGAAGAVEEDARLTALFLWTIQSTDGETSDDANDEGADEELSDEDDDKEASSRGGAKGFTLVFDVVRRFAQPLGIDLPKWEGRVIETKKGVVRLLPITERAKQLFGEDGAQAVAARLEQEAAVGKNPLQGMLFPDMERAPKVQSRGRGSLIDIEVSDERLASAREATTLDRVHAAMLLQAGGRTNALRALLKAEQERGPDFLRLANAFSALYPQGSEEKRLIDAMLQAVPR